MAFGKDSLSYTSSGVRLRHHSLICFLYALCVSIPQAVSGVHHMKRAPLAYVSQRGESKPLVISNLCTETIYPGIATQAGTAPSTGGFKLDTGQTRNLTVGADWQGRVWGRTNCSFNSDGTGSSNNGGNNGGGSACSTGDCNGLMSCKVTVRSFPLNKSTGLGNHTEHR